jgi:hypothetical protein
LNFVCSINFYVAAFEDAAITAERITQWIHDFALFVAREEERLAKTVGRIRRISSEARDSRPFPSWDCP